MATLYVRERQIHDVPGVSLASAEIQEPLNLSSRLVSNIATICIKKYHSYNFQAYPGLQALMMARGVRAEHLPLHFHVKVKDSSQELRIRTEDFREYEGLFIPSDLGELFTRPDVRDYLTRNTKSVFLTGRLVDQNQPNWN